MANTPMATAVAGRIRLLRRQRGWSAQQLADECAAVGMPSLTRGTIAKIESGVRKSVTADEIAVLSNVLGVTATELLVTSEAVVGLIGDDERDQLRELVREGMWKRPRELYRAALGPYASPPRPGAVDAVDLLSDIEGFNAAPDGMPPLLVFVEYLARQAQPDLADRLRAWNRGQAHRIGQGAKLAALERDIGGTQLRHDAEAYLIFALSLDGIASTGLRLQHWRQLGPRWAPERGADFVGDLSDVQRHVAELVTEAETWWAAETEIIRLEFVLPRDLLTLPVDQWSVNRDERMPQPLGLRYQVTIRSLERMQAREQHREWRRRWQNLTERISEPVMWTESDDPKQLRALTAALLTDQRRNILVLDRTPAVVQYHHTDVIDIGLETGVPVIVWQRDDRFTDELRATVNDLVSADTDLREGTRLLRAEAFGSDNPDAHVGSHLTLLWDDPGRLIEPLSTPAQGKG